MNKTFPEKFLIFIQHPQLKNYLIVKLLTIIFLISLNIENDKLRYYQSNAIKAIEDGVIEGKRAMLLAMATGTGKTFTLVSLIYRLLETKQFKRILFLVDRRALAAQAVREFGSFTTPEGK